ncbi:MAG TPA: TatD family deoxyribonuclease [Actinobacteria bacterium]|nr:TatD family deoxyribonuclease [Actinomycetes bacterium]HEX21038.1 TatD family deoxyribonuclease [Actinomycetota bacterium]
MTEHTDILTDTHAHLDMLGDNNTIRGIVSEARKVGVGRIISVGDSLDSSRRTAGITEQFARVYGAVGVHPHNAATVNDLLMEQIYAVSNQPKIVAIGETGLDFYQSTAVKDMQIKAFQAHIELAKHIDLPLMVHCRQAYGETLDILKKARFLEDKVVIHCFTGDKSQALDFLDLGCALSFSGILTFKNSEALRQVFKDIPLDKILLETDSPYLTPSPHRGEQNRPALLSFIADKAAELKGIDADEIIKVTAQNTDRIFKFSKKN